MVNILLAIVNTAELSWQQWNSVLFCFESLCCLIFLSNLMNVIRAKKVRGGGGGGKVFIMGFTQMPDGDDDVNRDIHIGLISFFLSMFGTQDQWMNFTRFFQIFKEEYRKRKTL